MNQHRKVDGVTVYLTDLEQTEYDLMQAAHAAGEPERAKREAISNVVSDFTTEVEIIADGYTQAEIDSWPIQDVEARAFIDDPSADTPLLDAILTESGETKADLVSRITANSITFKQQFGASLGRKQKKIKDIG